jgi:transcriptional regulator
MYTPPHDAEQDESAIRELVVHHPLATVVVPRADGQVEIAHVPVLHDGTAQRLRLHVARASRIWKDLLAPDRPGDVVVIFSGPQGYVSPTWYAKEDVPTWNYAVAHAHVPNPTEMDRPALLRLLEDIAAANEDPANAWRLSDHPADSRDAMLRAIVGMELPVARWDARFKLSRNRTADDHARVVEGLERRGRTDDHALADQMRRDRR